MNASNDRLKQARIAAKFVSARSAALHFGWNTSTYASHENGQTEVPTEAAFKYGKAFNISPIWILHGVGQKESIDAMLKDQPAEVWEHARDLVQTILKHRRRP